MEAFDTWPWYYSTHENGIADLFWHLEPSKKWPRGVWEKTSLNSLQYWGSGALHKKGCFFFCPLRHGLWHGTVRRAAGFFPGFGFSWVSRALWVCLGLWVHLNAQGNHLAPVLHYPCYKAACIKSIERHQHIVSRLYFYIQVKSTCNLLKNAFSHIPIT